MIRVWQFAALEFFWVWAGVYTKCCVVWWMEMSMACGTNTLVQVPLPLTRLLLLLCCLHLTPTNPTGYGSAGGVAYVNVWGRSDVTYYQPAFVFPGMLGNGYPK